MSDVAISLLRKRTIFLKFDHSDVDETPSRAPAPAPARTKAKTSRAKIDKLNAPIPALKIAATPRVKDEQSTDSFSPLAAVDVKGLPALVGPTWDTVFIPAAMRALYCSPEPMTFMTKGESNQSAAAAVAAVQTVLDSEYPGNNLTVEWGDKICSRISARIRERRSAIGQAGVDAVDAFIRGRDYRDNPVATRTYAKWAARPDGPAFFKIPSPENSPRDPKAKGYIPGKKYMDTPLMMKTVAPFLKDTKFVLPTERGPDNKYDFSGMPIGLFALGGAGVERGVNLYTETGRETCISV
ncbi:hypothetical protein B0H14DRAFT_3581425 [Mycena olivaceomarginata]|nr:hypothetical protein B0H14DRAFT_3581425 [Mycena olivaceomarginata]